MYNEYSNNDFRMLVTVFTVLISLFCGITYAVTTGNYSLKALDAFTTYCVFVSMVNGLLSLVLVSPMTRFVVTFFMTLVLPFIHLMSEKTTLVGADFISVFVIAANLFFLLCCIDEWRKNLVDEVIKKLNGFDPYFTRIRDKILKRCGDNDLEWGVENLSINKLFKLAHKARILDEEDTAEERRRIKYEEKDERRKIRFLNMMDI